MQDREGGNWTELARRPAPVSRRTLWETLLDKTEHPERYNDALRRAEVIDFDASTVLRRTFPGVGEPFVEWIHHEAGRARVEYRRRGETWRRAQAVVDGPGGPWLVYEVDDPAQAAAHGGVNAEHAGRVLDHLLDSAQRQLA